VAGADEVRRHDERRAAWESATHGLRAEMDKLLGARRQQERKYTLGRFRAEIQQAVLTDDGQRTPYQKQIALMAEKQLARAENDAPKKMTGPDKARYQELEKQMAAMRSQEPPPLSTAMAVTDVGRKAPPTRLLSGGDWRKPAQELRPGFPAWLLKAEPDTRIDPKLESTGRRAALARWLTRPDHPLTARVLVNRLWQHHFGAGIVATPNDFGSQGDAPTHPELLDWLAVDFVEHGWGLKHAHRQMVLSAAYCQSSRADRGGKAWAADRGNKLLWHANRRRLEGEALRDALLQLSGDLNLRMFGPSARPRLPEKVSSYAWKPDAKEEDQHRRSVYVFAKRNMRFPLFDAFDQPDLHNSCACRSKTTTAPQALLLLNSEFTQERAQRWGQALLARFAQDDRGLVAQAYRAAWGRPATEEEVRLGLKFLAAQAQRVPSREAAVTDFCQALMIANEFLYVD
jgi:hypothetical protein